jgi:predicted acylesterase/phospholipase RssA
MVTGTSTGAIAAPFAFLCSEYDNTLERIYTTTSVGDVASRRFLLAAINDDAMLDNGPLTGMITKYLDANVLRRIAEEYAKGRLLLISTTNLDTGKLVIWNIGAIAASSHPRRLALVRKIILASAAVPGLFPPVMLDVMLANDRHQEMHVDGGTIAQSFLYPSSVPMGKTATAAKASRPIAYVIRNGRIAPGPQDVERKTLSIAGRAIETMISSNGVGALYKIFAATQRDGVDFNLALITDEFAEPYTHAFDKAYMRKLFEFARTKARSGYAWQKHPPGFAQ